MNTFYIDFTTYVSHTCFHLKRLHVKQLLNSLCDGRKVQNETNDRQHRGRTSILVIHIRVVTLRQDARVLPINRLTLFSAASTEWDSC